VHLIDAVDAPATRLRGFRPTSRRRSRIASGVALGSVAVAGNVLVYSSLDDRELVLQARRDVPAGAVITEADLAVVSVDVDGAVRTVAKSQLATTIGRYAKVRLVAGSLVVQEALQDRPLVSPGAGVTAVHVLEGTLPVGLRERSRVRLVVPASDGSPPDVIDARVVGLPVATDTISGTVSLTVEVDVEDASRVAMADRIGVVLVEPDLVEPGLVEPGLVEPGLVDPGLVEPGIDVAEAGS
jgi:hypothetical protein